VATDSGHAAAPVSQWIGGRPAGLDSESRDSRPAGRGGDPSAGRLWNPAEGVGADAAFKFGPGDPGGCSDGPRAGGPS
jgi:hypothetical protein